MSPEMSTDPFVQQLRASLDLEALHSRIEPEAALAAGRRAARRHTIGTVAASALAVAAVGVGAVTLSGLAPSAGVLPAGPTSAASAAPDPAPSTVQLAPGLAAATGVTAGADGWVTGLTFGTHEIGLAPASTADLSDVAAATDVAVDHGLRVTLLPRDGSPSTVIAWAPTRGPDRAPTHPRNPSSSDSLRVLGGTATDGSGPTTRLLAGVVPPWLPDARVVLLTRGTVRVAGADVHAVEIPTFTDPAGSGVPVYLAVAGPEVDLGGYAPHGIFLVSPDGTFVDAEGTCTQDPDLCSVPRPDGLDVAAELRSALAR